MPSDVGLSDGEEEERKKPKKQRKKADGTQKAKRGKTTAHVDVDNRINFIKTNNKLIGEIENNEIYQDEDEFVCGRRSQENDEFIG